ncbi:13688_t:CDS:2, partial [Acaulospora morrowiae]
ITCQTLMVMYESSLEITYDRISERQSSKLARMTSYVILKGFDFILFTPLYPILRHSILRMVDSRFDAQDPIVFYNNYKRNLIEMFFKRQRGELSWLSTLIPTYVCHCIFEMVQIKAYRRFYKWMSPSSKSETKKETMLHEFFPELVCAIGSYLAAKFVTYPLETVVDRLMVQGYNMRGLRYTRYSGFWNCVHRMIVEEGIGSFYNGLFGGFIGECMVGFISLEMVYATYWVISRISEKFSNNRKRKFEKIE